MYFPDTVSFITLKKPSSNSFKSELERVPTNLKVEEAANFFDIILCHFNENLDESIGESILLTIRKLIRCSDFRNIFAGEFIDRLPFSNGHFANPLFNIMLDFVALDPDVFDETICSLFSQLIPYDPEKALIIIITYAQKMDLVEFPWPMLDLLFYESKQFNNRKTGVQYLTLLTYLCTTHDDFANGRAENCWKVICSMLTRNYYSNLQTGFDALRIIYKCCPSSSSGLMISLPISSIKANFSIDCVQPHILALLISLPLNHPSFRDKKFVGCLIELAETSDKATTLLLRIATDRENAEAILAHKGWANKELPSLMDTLRLFLVIFQHENLRVYLVAERISFVNFLGKLVDLATSGVFTVITTILRRVAIDASFLELLEQSGFLHAFIASAKNLDDNITMHSCLLLISTLAKVGYTPSYLEISATVANLAMKNPFLSKISCYTAADLNIYPECASIFVELKLDEYFKTKLEDKSISKVAKRFLEINR